MFNSVLFYCSQPVKKAWDEQKSIVQNLKDMGLSADPNKSLHITTTRVWSIESLSNYTLLLIRPHRSTAYVDEAYSYRLSSVVGRSVCLSVTIVSPAKTAEPIEMPFGLRTRVSPGNHVLDGVQIRPWERAVFGGGEKGRSIVMYRDILRPSVQKQLNQSRCHLGCGFRRAKGIIN